MRFAIRAVTRSTSLVARSTRSSIRRASCLTSIADKAEATNVFKSPQINFHKRYFSQGDAKKPKPPLKDEIVEDKAEEEEKYDDNDDNDDKDVDSTTIDHDGIDSYTRSLMAKRHSGILMNPDSISQHVLPGNQMVKTNQKTGEKKIVAIERSAGYFWFLKDLTDTNSKPVVANEALIPVDESQIFPPLNGMNDGSVSTVSGTEEALPYFFTKDNRASDPTAMCTLVGVNFNQNGNQMLPSWMDPFEAAFRRGNDRNRVKTAWLSIHEGRALSFLSSIIKRSFRNNVPEERKDRTLMYFGDCPDLRDVLRMHNNATGYVFLLDGVGRVRFAGSGNATEDEIETLVGLVKELLPGLKSKSKSGSAGKAKQTNS